MEGDKAPKQAPTAGHKYQLGEKWLESSPAEVGLGVLIDIRLKRSQHRALEARRQTASWGASNIA